MKRLLCGLLILCAAFTLGVSAWASDADVTHHWQRAKHLLKEGDYQGALDSLEQILSLNPDDSLAQGYRSLCEQRLRDPRSIKQLSPSDTRYFKEAFISYGYLKIHRNLERPDTFVEKIAQADVNYQFQFWLQQTFDRNVTPDLIRMLAEQIELPLEAGDKIQIDTEICTITKVEKSNVGKHGKTKCRIEAKQRPRQNGPPKAQTEHRLPHAPVGYRQSPKVKHRALRALRKASLGPCCFQR